MLISKKMNAAINEQVGNEFAASLQYVAIASCFAADGLPALADYFYRQAGEERDHAMRFVKYLVEAGGALQIPAIKAPRSDFKMVEAAVKLSLESELMVTKQINGLVELAIKESDHTTHNMLNWFVAEQLEEVSSMDNLLKIVQRAGEANMIHVEQYLMRHRDRTVNMASEVKTEAL